MKKTFAILLLFASLAWGQTVSSPDSTSVTALAVQGDGAIWCGTIHGIYESTNSGAAWTKCVPFYPYGNSPVSPTSIGVTDSLVIFSLNSGQVGTYYSPTGTTYPGNISSLPQAASYYASTGSTIAAFNDNGVYTSTDEGFDWKLDSVTVSSLTNWHATGFGVTDSGYFFAISFYKGKLSLGYTYSGVAFTRTIGAVSASDLSTSFDSLIAWAWPDSSPVGLASITTQLFTSGDTVFAVVDTYTIGLQSYWKTYYTVDCARSWQVATSLPSNVSAVAYGLVNPIGTLQKSSSTNYQAVRAIGTTDGKVYIGSSTVTSMLQRPVAPNSFSLSQNFPNPFNPTTKIDYTLSKPGPVSLDIYNALGEKVADLVDERQSAGAHEVSFNGSRLASGVYFYRLAANQSSDTKKMVLVK